MITDRVRAKKHFGQHFLNDEQIAKQIVEALQLPADCKQVLEIGPGMGVLTKYLVEKSEFETYVSEIDFESIKYIQEHFPSLKEKIVQGDFLQIDIAKQFSGSVSIIGNFPYNISSQILFKVLENKNQVPLVVGMFQKEVAVRLTSQPGNRDYGILSVLLQAWYDLEFLFIVEPDKFNPPPKVKSAVIRVTRKTNTAIGCDEKDFKKVIKQAFNQRRKTLRNALRSLVPADQLNNLPYLDLRAEALSWQQFVELTNAINSINTKTIEQ